MNILNAVLIAGTVVLWILSMVSLSELHGSDAAGNGLALAYGAFESVGVWIGVSILLIFSAVRGGWPAWARWAGLLLIPACAAASFIAIDLLNDTFYKARWPIVVPGVAPIVLLVYATWAYYPALRTALPAGTGSAAWGMVLLISWAPWPEYLYRSKHKDEDQAKAEAALKASEPQRMKAARQANLAALNKLGEDTPLRAFLDFIGPEMSCANRPLSAFAAWRGGSGMPKLCSVEI